MRRMTLLVLIGVLALGSASVWAQGSGRLTIQPFAGYRTSGSFGISAAVSLKYNALRVSDGFAYGLSVGFRLSPNATVEAQWARTDSKLEGLSPNPAFPAISLFNLFEDQVHANFLYYFGDPQGIVRPFFVSGLGVTIANPRGMEVSGETRFSFNIGLGFEKMFNDRVGVRLQGKWYPTYINSQLQWFVDWWGFAYLVPVNQYMTQWEFTGGLVFRF